MNSYVWYLAFFTCFFNLKIHSNQLYLKESSDYKIKNSVIDYVVDVAVSKNKDVFLLNKNESVHKEVTLYFKGKYKKYLMEEGSILVHKVIFEVEPENSDYYFITFDYGDLTGHKKDKLIWSSYIYYDARDDKIYPLHDLDFFNKFVFNLPSSSLTDSEAMDLFCDINGYVVMNEQNGMSAEFEEIDSAHCYALCEFGGVAKIYRIEVTKKGDRRSLSNRMILRENVWKK